MVLEHIDEQIARRIHDNANVLVRQMRHNFLIGVTGKTRWNRTGQHQGIARLNLIQLLIQLFHILLGNVRTDAVDFRFLFRFDFYIDAGHAFCHMNEIRVQTARL